MMRGRRQTEQGTIHPLFHGTTGFIDLYRRGCFVLEAKQRSDGPTVADRQPRGRGMSADADAACLLPSRPRAGFPLPRCRAARQDL